MVQDKEGSQTEEPKQLASGDANTTAKAEAAAGAAAGPGTGAGAAAGAAAAAGPGAAAGGSEEAEGVQSSTSAAATNDNKCPSENDSENLVGVQLGIPKGTEVIDWTAAIDQCSGDVSFLEELLVDLWNESNAHFQQLKTFVPNGSMLDTQHEAHAIKGAAANLMCHRLRLAALYMERAGQVGTRLQEGSDDFATVKGYLEKGLAVLEEQLGLFEAMLKQKKLI